MSTFAHPYPFKTEAFNDCCEPVKDPPEKVLECIQQCIVDDAAFSKILDSYDYISMRVDNEGKTLGSIFDALAYSLE